jgi:AcrR family transcriptional regulator
MATPRPRDRILAAATRRFYEEGIHATGVDRVVADAGVAPMTLYRHFAGKDQLVAAALERWSGEWTGWLEAEVERGGDLVGRVAGLWDALEKWFVAEGFRGSFVDNAALELRHKPGHPAHEVVAAHRAAVRKLLEGLARSAGASDPAGVAAQLHVLLDGAITVAVVDRQPGVAAGARSMAGALLSGSRSL